MPIGVYRRKVRPPIHVIGASIAYIELTQGQFALVDKWIADYLAKRNWYAQWIDALGGYYAVTKDGGKYISMHRFILGLKHGDERQADHMQQARTLDNRLPNIRIATSLQNATNKRRYGNNACGFKGVYLRKKTGKYRAQIVVNGRKIHLGYFRTAAEAHEAYKAAAIRYFGVFACFA